MEVEQPLFNSAKRRKFLRKRATSPIPDSEARDQPTDQDSNCATPSATPATGEDDDQSVPIAEILRARKALKSRRAGVEFSTDSGRNGDFTTRSSEMSTTNEASVGRLGGITDRFVGLSGQKVDVDKHMYVSFLGR